MPIPVRGSDGIVIEFPDGTPTDTINQVMSERHQEFQARQAAGNQQMGAQPQLVQRENPNVLPWQQQRNAQPQRSPEYQAEIQRRQSIRAPYTDQRWRREGVPEALVPLARGIESFNRNGPAAAMGQMWRNMGVQDDLAYWQNRIRGRDTAQAAYDDTQQEQARVTREQPGVNTAANVAGFVTMAGRPAAAAPRLSMLQGGAMAAGLNAPFALARQEGDLPQRLPGAAQESAVAFGLGGALTGVGNALSRAPRPNSASARAAQFEQAGVRPTLAAVNGGTSAGATRMIAENFVAGAPARARMQASLDDTANAARNLAGRYGQHGQPEQVGETVQRGVQRFARDRNAPRPVGAESAAPESIPTRDWSFRAKANALYDRIFQRISEDEAGHLAGQTGARATATETQQALAAIQGRVSAPNVAEIVNDPLIGRIANALAQDGENLRFNDLRALRTWVREARSRPALTQTIDDASLATLEGALTTDIYRSAMDIGDITAAQQLRRVDQFYRAGQNRIQSALQAFDPNRTGGAQSYQRIIALAREGGRQNTRQLQSLRNSLRPEEWREVSATIIDDMGRPTAGNPQALQPGAFSVEQFVTNYAKLSTEGRRILFGGAQTDELARALDNLAQVAGYQKGVEAMANRSRSGVNAQNIGTGLGLVNPGTFAPTAALLSGMAITGEMLTNPAFVRWMVSAARAGGGAGGMRQQLSALASLAARDPALAPFYTDLVRRVGDRSQAQASPQEQYSPQPQ